jgi:Bacterial capsule synthesis protein PGA_cap
MEPISRIRLAAVGDIALNGGYNQLAKTRDAQSLVAAIASLLGQHDIAIGNLEGPLTTRPASVPPSHFTLCGDPVYAPALHAAGISVVSLANNHMMDYGWEAVEETCTRLDAAGIRYVGAGRNLMEARKPLRLSVRGLRISILAYCNVSVLAPIYADVNRPGIALGRASHILEDIAATKADSDVLIVCMHWGQEHVHYPAPKYRRLAREMIKAGANLVIGHHPHVLQGVERIGDAVISYSLGNFTFSEEHWRGTNSQGEPFTMPYTLSEPARKAAVWKVLLDARGVVIEENLVPTYLKPDLKPVLDTRYQRHKEIERYRRALSRRAYALLWIAQMMRCRIRAIKEQLGGEGGLRNRIRRIRPRHVRDMLRLFIREWEQLRGME